MSKVKLRRHDPNALIVSSEQPTSPIVKKIKKEQNAEQKQLDILNRTPEEIQAKIQKDKKRRKRCK